HAHRVVEIRLAHLVLELDADHAIVRWFFNHFVTCSISLGCASRHAQGWWSPSSRMSASSLVPSGSSVLPRALLALDGCLHARERSIGARVALHELAPAILGHPQKRRIGLGQHRAVVGPCDGTVRLDQAPAVASDLPDHPQVLADRDRLAERDADLRGHAPDALMKDRPPHGLVEECRHDPAVQQPVVALMALKRRVARFGTITGYLELEAQATLVELPAREAPVLKVDPELRQLCH